MSEAEQRATAGTVILGKKPQSGTLVEPPSQLAETAVPASMAPTHVAPVSALAMSSSSPSTSWRSTVLPKLRAGAARPELVHSERPRYEKQGMLGEGGVGEVVRSVDNDIERPVAIKRLKADMRDPGHVARFVDEIRTVGSMEHPNIVPIHDVGVDEDGQYYFVMKYVDGETLEAIIERLRAGDRDTHARYGFERRVEIFLGVLEAVAYAHARGILHRDIKPANVMVGRFGEVTVMDWGIARTKGGSDAPSGDRAAPAGAAGLFQTQAGTLIGTPAYMSPEQARCETLDERSDVYSLSVLFHELLCLTHYLGDATTLDGLLAGVKEKQPRFASFVGSPHQSPVPAELAHFVAKGVAKDPSERYAGVGEMIERLQRRADGDFPIQCPITFMKRTTSGLSHFVDQHPLAATVLASVATLGGLGALARAALHAFG